MNRSGTPLRIIYPKPKCKSVAKSFEERSKAQIASLFKLPRSLQIRNLKNAERNPSGLVLKSFRYESPTSCQSSDKMSRNPSKQRRNVFRCTKTYKEIVVKKKKKQVGHKSFAPMKMKADKTRSQKDQTAKFQWKASILQRFVVNSNICRKCKAYELDSLESTLKSYLGDDKNYHSRSFIKCALTGGVVQREDKTCLGGRSRVLTIDWMFLISASLLLNRETVHLAIHYLDSYFIECGGQVEYMHTVASACLYLAVKQEERDSQVALIDTVCLSEKMFIQKSSIVEMEQQILMKLHFKLKSNTLVFWVDYFTLKWDAFVTSVHGTSLMSQADLRNKILLRDSDGDCYKLYREVVELADCCLLLGRHLLFPQAHVSLACLYLVLRVEIENKQQNKAGNKENRPTRPHPHPHPNAKALTNLPNLAEALTNRQKPPSNTTVTSEELFKRYHKQFSKKASPIFRDPWRVNQVFNGFVSELCEFQMSEIIPVIKEVSHLLDLQFCYNIDNKAMEESESYEDFIRRMTYSVSMKEYALNRVLQ